MNFEMIILMVIRALGGLGKIELEKILDKIDSAVCSSPTKIDDELYFNVLMAAIKEHEFACSPPK